MSSLSSDRQRFIDAKINELLTNVGMFYPEDDLLSITKKLGIKVVVSDLSEFGTDISGIVFPKDLGVEKDTIFINEKEELERRNFTLAHELGHYILHDGARLRIDKYNYRNHLIDTRDETEANYFAASLLMPKELFVQIFRESGSDEATARFFGVSKSAVRNRDKWIRMNK